MQLVLVIFSKITVTACWMNDMYMKTNNDDMHDVITVNFRY